MTISAQCSFRGVIEDATATPNRIPVAFTRLGGVFVQLIPKGEANIAARGVLRNVSELEADIIRNTKQAIRAWLDSHPGMYHCPPHFVALSGKCAVAHAEIEARILCQTKTTPGLLEWVFRQQERYQGAHLDWSEQDCMDAAMRDADTWQQLGE